MHITSHLQESLHAHALGLLNLGTANDDATGHARMLGALVAAAQRGEIPVAPQRDDRVFARVNVATDIVSGWHEAHARDVLGWWSAQGHEDRPSAYWSAMSPEAWRLLVDGAKGVRVEQRMSELERENCELHAKIERLTQGGLDLDAVPLLRVALAVYADLRPEPGAAWTHTKEGVLRRIFEDCPNLTSTDAEHIRALITPPDARVGGRPSGKRKPK